MNRTFSKSQVFPLIGARAEELLSSPLPMSEKLEALCDMLTTMVPYYDWVGFYFVDHDCKNELVLGPYVGEPTEHVRIPFGRGICGRAAETGKTFVVQDVSKETNYLSCNISVKSEIVVPIIKDGAVIGELDIDSHTSEPFSEEDTDFLEKIAGLVGCAL
jgi:GAF domain-containing protein